MVRAIEMHQGIIQTHATEKIQRVQQEHPDMQQRYFSAQLQEEKKRLSERVPRAEELEKKIIDEEQERKKREQDEHQLAEQKKILEEPHETDGGLIREQGVYIDIKA